MQNTLIASVILTSFFPIISSSQEMDWSDEIGLIRTMTTNITTSIDPDTESDPGSSVYESKQRFVVPFKDLNLDFVLREVRYTDAGGDGWSPGDEIIIDWVRSSDNTVFKYKINRNESSVDHWTYVNPPSWANMSAFPEVYGEGSSMRTIYKACVLMTGLCFDPRFYEEGS